MSIKAWYPFYITDFQKDTELLEPIERGFYRDLMDAYWLHVGDISEKDAQKLMKKRGFSPQSFRKHWQKISMFFPIENGKLTNKRLDIEIAKALKNHETAVANGRAGGEASKQAKEKNKHKQNSSSSPSPSPIPDGKGDKPPHHQDDQVFKMPMDWAAWFVSEYQYQIAEAQTDSTIPMFKNWVDGGVTVGDVRAMMAKAEQTLGDKPASPSYLKKPIERLCNNASKQQKLQAKAPPRSFENTNYRDGVDKYGFKTVDDIEPEDATT